MDTFLYWLLGMLDSLAVIALMYKIFRFPLRQYKVEIAAACAVISFISYINRMLLDIAQWDMAIQFACYVLWLIFVIRVRLPDAIDMSAIGYLSFVGIQFTVYPLLLVLKVVTADDSQQLTGFGTYVIQISGQLACYLVCFVLWRFRLGFSHILLPPHDKLLLYRLTGTKLVVYIANTVGTIVVCSTMYWVLNHQSGMEVVLLSTLCSLAIILYLSYRRDYGR